MRGLGFGLRGLSALAICGAAGSLASCGVGSEDGEAAEELGATQAALESDTVLSITQDTSIRLSAPNRNFGTAAQLDVNRGLVKVTPEELAAAVGPNGYVIAARLELTLIDRPGRRTQLARNVGAYRVVKPWTELGATWFCAIDSNPNNRRPDCSGATAWQQLFNDGFVTTPSSTAVIPASRTGVVGLDVTADVRAFATGAKPNEGWLLKTPIGAMLEVAEFGSAESATPPRLVLRVRRCEASACDDNNACTADSCDATAECVHTPLHGTTCDDGNSCTAGELCSAGSCGVGAARPEGSACGAGQVCSGEAAQCVPANVVINEVESNGGTPGDWVELYNAGATAVDLSGYRFRDNDDARTPYTLPAGIVIPAGGYYVLEEAQFGFGLGGGDSARLYAPTGDAPIAAHTWTSHAAVTYGRCPSGSGPFTSNLTSTKGATNDCSTLPDAGVDAGVDAGGGSDGGVATTVVINEVESNGGTPGDWVELYNAGTTAADLSGYRFRDNDPGHTPYTIPAGTVLEAGAYLVLEESQFGWGLGGADSAELYPPTGASPVAVYSWTAHAAITYGRCPNGSGAFAPNASSTKGATNDCGTFSVDAGVDGGLDAGDAGTVTPSPVVVNEVESNGGTPGDWVELYNASAATVDLSGYRFRDNDVTHAFYTIPSGTVLEPGSYLVLEEAQFGFGLGGADSAGLYAPTGDSPVEIYSWPAHAAVTYGRCPNGSGALVNNAVSTKGAANDCRAASDAGVDGGADAGPPYAAWPGPSETRDVDPVALFTSNLSGVTYQPSTASTPPVLWAVLNGPSRLYRLEYDGNHWVPAASDDWSLGKTLFYTNAAGGPDSEGVTKAEWDSPAIYVATERDNTVSGVSRLSILRFDTSVAGATLTATHEWNLNAFLPVVGPNLGLEAITWIPDSYLVGAGFIDQFANEPYDPSAHPNHGSGVFFVGVEGSGMIYALTLDHVAGTARLLAAIASEQAGTMGLEFDRDQNYLWSYCDDTCGNRSTVLSVVNGQFAVRGRFERPAGLLNTNHEGIAIAPESECSSGTKAVYWVDDSDGAGQGHSLRQGSLTCGPLF